MSFSHPECEFVVAIDILWVEVVNVNQIWPEMVNDGAETKTISPWGRHVDDVDLAIGDELTPVLQVFRSLKSHLMNLNKAAAAKG